MNLFVPTIEKAVAAFTKVVADLEAVAAHHEEKAEKHRLEVEAAFNSKLQSEQQRTKAQRLAAKLKGILED